MFGDCHDDFCGRCGQINCQCESMYDSDRRFDAAQLAQAKRIAELDRQVAELTADQDRKASTLSGPCDDRLREIEAILAQEGGYLLDALPLPEREQLRRLIGGRSPDGLLDHAHQELDALGAENARLRELLARAKGYMRHGMTCSWMDDHEVCECGVIDCRESIHRELGGKA